MKSFIDLTRFEIIEPSIQMNQQDVLDHIAKAHQKAAMLENPSQNQDDHSISILLKRYAVKPTQIARRGFENIKIAANQEDILARTLFFGSRGRQILAQFYQSPVAGPQNNQPDHIVHVTCTGYISPSPAQHLVNDKNWTDGTGVTHAYHMGCYASLPAVRIAEGLVAARHKQVDIVHTEMCGLHMDARDNSPEQLVVQSLFADGHIKYTAVPAGTGTQGFKVFGIKEKIVPDSQADMSWVPASWGMKMSLSREVPAKIAGTLRGFVKDLVEQSGFSLDQVLKNAIFAVHPGGPKIIDSVREILELSEDQVKISREILLSRGNMSSATLPHVWEKILHNDSQSGRLVVSLAFGPGLTIFGALFEII